MGKKDKKKKGKGAEKTAMKTDKKLAAKQKKMLEKLGEDDIREVITKLEAAESSRKAVSEVVCPAPTPRSSFSLMAHPEKEELILFGGEFYNGQRMCVYNDLYIYSIAKNEWKQIQSPSGPTPRSGHQMVAVATDGGQLWLFGGEHASPSQLQFYHYKDLWFMSLKTRKWEKVNAPNGPSARSGHRMVASKKRLVVFGGFHDNNQSYQYFNDVHMFSLENFTWLKIQIDGPTIPPARSACCMAACADGKIMVWGGYSKTNVKKDVDRGITHTDMYALTVEKTNPTGDTYKWSTVKPGGYKPLPRSSVGCTTAPNGKVYCFGGVMDVKEDEEELQGQFGDELLAFDLSAKTWRLLEIATKSKNDKTNDGEDTATTSSADTASTTTDGIFTMTVGGASKAPVLPKVPSLFPNRKPVNTSMPSPRMNAALCVCKGKLYVYGGICEEDDKQITFNDFYAIDLHKIDEWKVLIPNSMNAHDWIECDDDSSDSEDEDDDDDDDDNSDDNDSASEMDTD